jgi:rhodanese-related sulfurtransferase
MTEITQATPAQLRDGLTSGEVLLVDVREPNEYAFERIHGALLYPLSTFDPKAIPGSGRRLVVQCAGGVRSMRAAQALVAAGHTNVVNLEGGINAWKAAGLPLIRIDPATGEVIERGTL